jgi:3-hydroxyisobutyrate dehydrogenase-like beta-hydroxyacid dehydrogenase
MSKRILNAGFSVKAFDVDFERVSAPGLSVASSLSELRARPQFVFTMISDDDALEELVLDALG